MTEQILNEIVFNTAGAVKAIDALANKLDKYSKDLIKVSRAEDKASKEAKKARAFFDKLASSTDKASASAKKLAAGTKAATTAGKENTGQNKKQKKSADDLGVSWTTVKRIFAGQVIFRALSAITNQMRDSVGVAQDLGIALAEAITIAPGAINLSVEGVASLGREIKGLSESFGVDQVELASAAYQVYSNQIGNATESTKFLEQAVLFAKATVTNTANAVDLLAGVVNSYGLEAGEAARISDVFTKAVELGRFRIDDIANSMGRVNPIAAQLGISIEEVAAAFSTLTIKGVSPDKAMTQLLATMLKLIKPSSALTKALNQIGFSSVEQAIGSRGLVGTLKALIGTTDGSTAAIGRLFPRVRAIQGVLGLVGDEGERFDSIFTDIQETSRGATRRFAEFILATDAEQFKRNIQAIKNLFIEDFGKPVIGIINDLIAAFGGVPDAINRFNKVIQVGAIALAIALLTKLTLTILAVRTAYIGAALAAGGFAAATGAAPLALLAVGAAAAVVALDALIRALFEAALGTEALKEKQRALAEDIKTFQTEIVAGSNAAITGMTRLAEQQLDLGREAIRQLVIENQGAADQIAFIQNQVTDNIIGELDRRQDRFEKFADESSNALERALKKTDRIDKKIAREQVKREKDRFDASIRGLSKWQTRVAQARESRKLLDKAIASGDIAAAEVLFSRARLLADRADSDKLKADISAARIKALEAEKDEVINTARLVQKLAPDINLAVEKMKDLQTAIVEAGKRLVAAGLDQIKIDIETDLIFKLGREQKDEIDKLRALVGDSVPNLEKEIETKLGVVRLPVEFRFLQSVKDMEAALATRKISFPVFAALAGIVGTDGKVLTPDSPPEAASLIINQLEKDLKTAQIITEDQIVNDLGPVVETTRDALSKLIDEVLAGKLLNFGEGAVVIPPSQQVEKEAEAIKAALAKFAGAVISKDIPRINDSFQNLNDVLAESKNIKTKTLQEGLEQIGKQLETVNKNPAGILRIQQIGERLQAAAKASAALAKSGPGAAEALRTILFPGGAGVVVLRGMATAARDIGPAAQQGAQAAIIALNTIGSAARLQLGPIEAMAKSLRAVLALQQQTGTSKTIVTEATGGQIPSFLAAGGPTQSRGTDTVSVQAAPGEFFVNAASSRRFIPELVAINQGRAPESRSNSQVTNNSFSGDININVPSGAKIDGRSITQDIRRELRRKTSSLS